MGGDADGRYIGSYLANDDAAGADGGSRADLAQWPSHRPNAKEDFFPDGHVATEHGPRRHMRARADKAIMLHHCGGIDDGKVADLRASMDYGLGQNGDPLP
ncbi:hypothetical protein MAE02_23170 [Microvirga aerophila]|uniref:Uncharacterized protein n=1 Tax=Microvirga aerophila TaxID=670291 RepID=A0A512BRR4_9HYPH|nr:hypothetical protein MAE02_23170 [Microvirga aerophila]